eukprot:3941543-Rhodomonas_salina.2
MCFKFQVFVEVGFKCASRCSVAVLSTALLVGVRVAGTRAAGQLTEIELSRAISPESDLLPRDSARSASEILRARERKAPFPPSRQAPFEVLGTISARSEVHCLLHVLGAPARHRNRCVAVADGPVRRCSGYEVLVHPAAPCVVSQHALWVPLQPNVILAVARVKVIRVVEPCARTHAVSTAHFEPPGSSAAPAARARRARKRRAERQAGRRTFNEAVERVAHGLQPRGEGLDALVVVAVDVQAHRGTVLLRKLLVEPARERRLGQHRDGVAVTVVVVVVDVLHCAPGLRGHVKEQRAPHRHVEELRAAAQPEVRHAMLQHVVGDERHLDAVLGVVDLDVSRVLRLHLRQHVLRDRHVPVAVRVVRRAQVVSLHHKHPVDPAQQVRLQLLCRFHGARQQDRHAAVLLHEVYVVLAHKVNVLSLSQVPPRDDENARHRAVRLFVLLLHNVAVLLDCLERQRHFRLTVRAVSKGNARA